MLLTFNVSFCNFLFALLLDNKTALEVATKFAALKERVMDGGYAFHQLFPVILTDNGSEFSYVEELERDIDGSLTSTSATLAVLTRRGGLRRTIRFCELFFPRVLPLTS